MMTFNQKVYEVVIWIPAGKVATYGQIAHILDKPQAVRAVGRALHQNLDPRHIPCHRVVSREGKLASHFAFGGLPGQRARLIWEGVEVKKDGVDLKRYQVSFDNLTKGLKH